MSRGPIVYEVLNMYSHRTYDLSMSACPLLNGSPLLRGAVVCEEGLRIFSAKVRYISTAKSVFIDGRLEFQCRVIRKKKARTTSSAVLAFLSTWFQRT